MKAIGSLAIISPFIRRYRTQYAGGIVVLIIVDLLQIIIPCLIGKAVDGFYRQTESLAWLMVMLLAVALLIAALRFLYRELIIGTTRRMEHFLRERLFIHSIRLPLDFYDQHGPSKIMALTTNDIAAVRMAVGFGVMIFTDAVIIGLLSFIMMVNITSWELAFWAVLPLPLIMLAAIFMGDAVHHRFKTVQEKFSQMTETAQETFAGLKVIKSFAAEMFAIERFGAVSKENVVANMELAKVQAAYVPLTHTLPLFSYAMVIYIGGRYIMEGMISVGDMTAFIGYLGLVIWPIMGLGYLFNVAQRGLASLGRIAEILKTEPYEQNLNISAATLPACSFHIRNLVFRYPGTNSDVLQGVTLNIPEGSTVGIVGRTGAGKSTLLKLLLRLYDPPAQQIFIGDTEIHNINYLSLRTAIGYVPQDSLLFSRTIGDNIAFDQDYPREEILEAARLAAVREGINEKPDGFGTVLGEKGHRLSGGQQQRVAIARALIKKPSVLFLDDVFSALDYRTQAELMTNLRDIIRGRTTVIVSQRVAVVREADFIVVMDDGRIVETGTHDELVARQGLYYDLYEQQLLNGEE